MDVRVWKLLESLQKNSEDKLEISINLDSNDTSRAQFKEFVEKFHRKYIINCITKFDKENLKLLEEYQKNEFIHRIGIILDKYQEMAQVEYVTRKSKLKNVVYHIDIDENKINFLKWYTNLNVLVLKNSTQEEHNNQLLPDFSTLKAIDVLLRYQNKHNLIFDDSCKHEICKYTA